MAATLFYFHDPMCSWCWGYQKTWQKLLEKLPSEVNLTYILGGLAPDDDTPMPEDMQQAIQGYWRKIQTELGAEFNFDFCRGIRRSFRRDGVRIDIFFALVSRIFEDAGFIRDVQQVVV